MKVSIHKNLQIIEKENCGGLNENDTQSSCIWLPGHQLVELWGKEVFIGSRV